MPPSATFAPNSRVVGVAAAAFALAVWLWGALPYLPGQIDDAYIVFAYAHNIVERGEIVWNTGDRVEGYSSALHLCLMTLGCLAHLDLSVFARVVSVFCAAATIGLLFHPKFGPNRTVLALFVAAWQPFQHWSTGALETALATLIGAAAWPMIFGNRRTWAVGCLLLTGFAVTRPEGVAWLAAGVLMRWRMPPGLGRPEAVVSGGLWAFLAYHVARVAYFGEAFPTPWLVKVVAISQFGRGGTEAGWELLSAGPLLALAAVCRRRTPIAVWFPLALQAGMLVRSGGDWMGNARFLLPGVIASLAAAFAAGVPRTMPRFAPAALVPFAALSFAFEPAQMQGKGPRWRDSWFLVRPIAALESPWRVPLMEEVRFLIERMPEGSGAELSDVGLPGNLDGIRIWDSAGLTDRVVAELIAGTDPEMSAPLKARFDEPKAIWCIRYGVDADGIDPGDAWMKEMFSDVARTPDERGLLWRCRPGGEPSHTLVIERWRRLSARFPREDEIRLEYARAVLASGDPVSAIDLARKSTWVGADAVGWLGFFPPVGESYTPGRGWPMYTNGSFHTALFAAEFWQRTTLQLDVDDGGAEGGEASIHWIPECGPTIRAAAHGPTLLDLPACNAAEPRALVVDFLNDDWSDDHDRNLYVTLLPKRAIRAPK